MSPTRWTNQYGFEEDEFEIVFAILRQVFNYSAKKKFPSQGLPGATG
jgi:hypothetical protein